MITRLASQCPIPLGATAAAARNDCTDSTTTAGSPLAAVAAGAAKLPEWLNRLDSDVYNAGQFGGSTFGIVSGLALSDGGGLLAGIASGSGWGGVSLQYGGGTKSLGDNRWNHLWLTAGQTIAEEATLSPPVGALVFLGSVLTASGVITQIDLSGVCYVRGGISVRSTADPDKPGDSPSVSTRLLTRTLHDVWLWDGTSYSKLAGPILPQKDTLVSGDSAYIPSGHQVAYFDSFTVGAGASLQVAGKMKVTA